MTTRHSSYLVVLADDVREDDGEHIVGALRMVKGVASVQPVEATYEDTLARSRRDGVWVERLDAVIRELRG